MQKSLFIQAEVVTMQWYKTTGKIIVKNWVQVQSQKSGGRSRKRRIRAEVKKKQESDGRINRRTRQTWKTKNKRGVSYESQINCNRHTVNDQRSDGVWVYRLRYFIHRGTKQAKWGSGRWGNYDTIYERDGVLDNDQSWWEKWTGITLDKVDIQHGSAD